MNKYLIQDGEEIKKYTEGKEAIFNSLDVTSELVNSNVTSSGYTNSNYPSLAKNGLTDDFNGWVATSRSNVWLQYKFDKKKEIHKYRIAISSTGVTLRAAPKNWRFEGSNNEIDWDVLDEQMNVSDWIHGVYKDFEISSEKIKPYLCYRIFILENNGNQSQNSKITEMRVHERITVEPGQESMWYTLGPAPVIEEMFLEHGMEDISFLNEETISQLSSAKPELLCWTDETDPVRRVRQTVTPGWYPVSNEMPSKEVFLEEGHTNLSLLPAEAWLHLKEDFDVFTYTNKLDGNQNVRVSGTPNGQLILAETDFSLVEELIVTASLEGVKIIVSGDSGLTWKTFTTEWEFIQATPEETNAKGMTPSVFNDLTADDWKEVGNNIRLGYYVEDDGLVESVTVTKEAMSTETPSLDRISIAYDSLTIEGRLKDLEKGNADNLAKLQFKTNTLMKSKKYHMHDLVIDTFESNTLQATVIYDESTFSYKGQGDAITQVEELPEYRKHLMIYADHDECMFEYSLDNGATWRSAILNVPMDISEEAGNKLTIRVMFINETAELRSLAYGWA